MPSGKGLQVINTYVMNIPTHHDQLGESTFIFRGNRIDFHFSVNFLYTEKKL